MTASMKAFMKPEFLICFLTASLVLSLAWLPYQALPDATHSGGSSDSDFQYRKDLDRVIAVMLSTYMTAIMGIMASIGGQIDDDSLLEEPSTRAGKVVRAFSVCGIFFVAVSLLLFGLSMSFLTAMYVDRTANLVYIMDVCAAVVAVGFSCLAGWLSWTAAKWATGRSGGSPNTAQGPAQGSAQTSKHQSPAPHSKSHQTGVPQSTGQGTTSSLELQPVPSKQSQLATTPPSPQLGVCFACVSPWRR